jgi:hypothetical protein
MNGGYILDAWETTPAVSLLLPYLLSLLSHFQRALVAHTMSALARQDFPSKVWINVLENIHWDLNCGPEALLSFLVVNKRFKVGLVMLHACF